MFTSPNLHDIPFVEVAPTQLYARADGRFGLEDYIVWPQSFSEAYPWAPCILRKPAPDVIETHPYSFLWEDVTPSEWVAPPGASWQRTGVLRQSFHSILRHEMQPIMSRVLHADKAAALPTYVVIAVHALTATLARLQDLPMSYRDLVLQTTQAQRLALDLLAMEAYYGHLIGRMNQRRKVYPLRAELMGCHTVNPTTVENMFYAGIPVVYIRPSVFTTPSQVRVSRIVYNFAQMPDGIVTAPWPGSPCKVLHDGASNTRRFQMSRPLGRYFEDIMPLPDATAPPLCMAPFFTEDPYQGGSGVSAMPSDQLNHLGDDPEQPHSMVETLCSPSTSKPLPTPSPHRAKVFRGGVVKHPLQPNSRQARKKESSKFLYVRVSLPSTDEYGRLCAETACRGTAPAHPLGPHGAALQPVNRNKWQVYESPLMPPHCAEWVVALRGVNRRVECRSVIPKLCTGLMYPDPVFMVSVTPTNRAFAIAAWLSIRPARCGQMLYPSSPQMPVVSASVWRQFFWIYKRKPSSPMAIPAEPSDTGNPSLDGKLDAATAAAKCMFGPEMAASMNRTSREVFWKARAYDVVDGAVVGIGDQAVREIVWELAELNWRYELLTLDKYAAPHMWLHEDSAGDRITALLLVYSPSSSFVLTHSPFPTDDSAICARTRAQRLQAFTALRRVMSAWPGCPMEIQHAVTTYTPSSSDCPESTVIELQTLRFYCQTFYEYFHRPPIIPCQLPF